MSVKSELRQELLKKRSNICGKVNKDRLIAENLFELQLYKETEILLCYVTYKNEINTDTIINRALADGKTVAVPYCRNKRGDMDFYIISSLDELCIGSFGLREPDTKTHKKLEEFEKSIIIVPGLSFDSEGYRLGYGGGYYDRFLAEHNIISVGLCYSELISEKLPRDSFDLPIDILITETKTLSINGGEYGL